MLFKTLFIILFFTVNPQSNCSHMPEVRADFHAILTEDELKAFIEDMDHVNCEFKLPYLASAIMRQAEFTSWPFRKLNHFKEGRKVLEDFISANPNNIEGRYIRLLCQLNAPSFLNYDNIDEDRAFVNEHIKTANLTADYKKTMLFNIKKHTNK